MFVPLLWFSDVPLLLNAIVGIISAIAIYEVLVASKYIEGKVLTVVSVLFAFLVPFIPGIIDLLPITGLTIDIVLIAGLFAFTVTFVVTLIIAYGDFSFEHIAVMFFVIVTISIFLTSMIYTRKISYENSLGEMKNFGVYYIYLVFIGAWVTDTGGYVWGRLFGKHKLIEKISPKKTIEGAIGAVLTTTVFFAIFGLVIEHFYSYEINYVLLMTAGFCTSLMAMLGDLMGSIIKRSFKVKDFGAIIPGHGGVLDRFDSVVLTAPFVYLFFSTFHVIK